jgi:O-antigen/teichoic acid export membrane protein
VLAFIQRFALSTAGPASVAAANLLVSILLLAQVPAAEFGLYAFVQVLITSVGFGVSNAIFGSPLMIALNRTGQPAERAIESFARANLIVSTAGATLLALGLLALGAPASTSIAFAVSALQMWIRWFGRSLAYARHQPMAVVASDMSYSIVLLVGMALAWWNGLLKLESVAVVQSIAAVVGLIALGAQTFSLNALKLIDAPTAPFVQGFRQHGRHALLGVLSTEATANAHAYIVTLMLGPAAFAPLAAAALFFRPVPLVLQSMNQFERPMLATMLRDGDHRRAWETVSLIRLSALSAWAASALLAFVVVTWFLADLLHHQQDPSAVTVSAIIWALIFGVQCLRAPESTLVQADGQFRPLSMATVHSGLVTVPVVAVLALTHGAVWSLFGVLIGEIVAALSIIRLARTRVAAA